jgi:hypothetical protein
MSKLHTTLVMVLVAFALGISASAAPQLIDYQGFLEDDNGNPITDTLSITFTIYTASTGGTSKWTETQSSVAILDGLFNVTLGSSTPIPDTVFNQDERWLKITVGGNGVSPRTRIVSTAYAHRVNTVDGASGGTINGDLTAGKGNFGASNSNSGNYAFVAGLGNIASGNYSTVGGGVTDTADGWYSSVCGGYDNRAHEFYSTVGGGYHNRAIAEGTTVAGGEYCEANGYKSTVGGGYTNVADGQYSVVPGGTSCWTQGSYSFAAGRRARAYHAGTFVWADSMNAEFTSSRVNQFRARANGGARFDVNNSRWVEMYDDGTNLINTSTGARLTLGGVWTNASDKNLKENFAPVDSKEILRKVASLPISRWNYKSESDKVTHIGPVAQDFHSLFSVGNDDKTISTIDPAGVALAAIQGLYEITQELQKKSDRINTLESQVAELQAQVATLLAERQAKSADGKAYSAIVGK